MLLVFKYSHKVGVVEYVLVYAKPVLGDKHSILVLLKNRPAWQVGKLNLVGGKIEKGETPEQAAIRELKEESGLSPLEGTNAVKTGCIQGSWGRIFCIKICVDQRIPLKPLASESELVAWMRWCEIRNHELLMPNLRVAIPLIKEGIADWIIEDTGPSWDANEHSFSIIVPSHNKSKGEPVDRT